MSKSLFCEHCICVFIRNVQILRILCDNGLVRIHSRTAKNTTLHHPSMHSDNDTDPTHNKSRQFRTHLMFAFAYRAVIIKTHAKITSALHASPSPLPLRCFTVLNCFELDERSKTDPTIDDLEGANARALRKAIRVIRTVHHLEDRHIRDRCTRFALASGILDVICVSDEKSAELTPLFQLTVFAHFLYRKTGPT